MRRDFESKRRSTDMLVIAKNRDTCSEEGLDIGREKTYQRKERAAEAEVLFEYLLSFVVVGHNQVRPPPRPPQTTGASRLPKRPSLN